MMMSLEFLERHRARHIFRLSYLKLESVKSCTVQYNNIKLELLTVLLTLILLTVVTVISHMNSIFQETTVQTCLLHYIHVFELCLQH